MSLTTQWQKALNEPSGMKVYTEIVFDPDGRNIVLDGLHDLNYISPIRTEISLHPSDYTKIRLDDDVMISINDPDNFFIKSGSYNPFKYLVRIVYQQTTLTTIAVQTQHPSAVPFKVGEHISISDGVNLETTYVRSYTLHESAGKYYQLMVVDEISNTYAAGSFVANQPIIGQRMDVRLRFSGLVSGTKTIWRGVVKSIKYSREGKADIILQNYLGQFLLKSIKRTSGLDEPGLADPSYEGWGDDWGFISDEGSQSTISVNSDCIVGRWNWEFYGFYPTTTYKVTGSSCHEKNGTTGVDFYDISSNIYNIKLPSSAWSGNFQEDDAGWFIQAINFQARTIPYIIWQILKLVAEVPDELIDVHPSGITYVDLNYSFNYLHYISNSENDKYNISVIHPITVGETIALIAPHGMCLLYINSDGKFAITRLQSGFNIGNVSIPGTHTRWLHASKEQTQTTIYNEFIINYRYSNLEEQYTAILQFPRSDDENPSAKVLNKKNRVEIYLPFVWTEAKALELAQKYYSFFAWPRKYRKVDLGLLGMDASIGHQFQLQFKDSADDPYTIITKTIRTVGKNYKAIIEGYEKLVDALGAW